MYQIPPEFSGTWEESLCRAVIQGGFEAVLDNLFEFAEDHAEWVESTRRAGDQGLSTRDIRGWKQIAEKIDALRVKVANELRHTL